MGTDKEKITSFTKVRAWQEGHKLVLMVYEVTKNFPKEEMFGLVNQLRRAAVSITSNIAEGFSRKTYGEKLQFYCIALGSLTEVQNQILIAKEKQKNKGAKNKNNQESVLFYCFIVLLFC